MLKKYLREIFGTYSQGDAREESFYETLANLFREYANSTNRKNIHVTTLPKKTEAGNPDFRIWDGKQHIVGYIEAKKPETEIDSVEFSDQLKRYKGTFPNLILTNFSEFRLYRNGKEVERVAIARPFWMKQLGKEPPLEKKDEFLKLLAKFFSFSLPKVYDPKTLATELAKRTRFLKDEVIEEELKNDEQAQGHIHGFYEAFKKFLLSGLSKKEFADLYSQTITFGLFVARTRTENSFNRKLAFRKIPNTIGILRDIFKFISLEELPGQMEWTIDDISDVLAVTDLNSILKEYSRKAKDPIFHFYETFLSEFDPKMRKKRGEYYTPLPVVSYITKSLHQILKEKFGKPYGFASENVTVLDPAAGTLTFLAETAKLAVDEFTSSFGCGSLQKFVKKHILQDFFAFEIMMAPYAVGHLKMSLMLQKLGYKMKDDERFNLYLTNTLETENMEQTYLPGWASISEESEKAGSIKTKKPILVILGNPPYAGISANKNDWIDKLLKKNIGNSQSYYKVDGKSLGERNPKWLQDDYVKFIRFAQWKIDQAGEGVLGFITNHSYLDNPTFRGMRQSLMKTFNEIYILDLHGNSLKREKCPDGSKDENVFDIRVGVSIVIFVKNDKLSERSKISKSSIFHSELYGKRNKKYKWLEKNDITTTKWKKITPHSNFYLFKPRDETLLKYYDKFQKITEVFPLNSVGIVTSRDNFVIDKNKNSLENRIRRFKNSKLSDDELHKFFTINNKKNWDIRKAWNMLHKIDDSELETYIKPILYRPFDLQWIFYHYALIERSRKEIMRNMMNENMGLITSRQMNKFGIEPVFITDLITDAHSITSAVSISYIFPLYSYPDKSKNHLFENHKEYKKETNLNNKLINYLKNTYKEDISPEEIFYYIYAILYSNIYRKKYAEFLKIDFPKIPFTKNYENFITLGKLGKKLADLHSLKSDELSPPLARFQGQGDCRIDKQKKIGRNYNAKENRVYINKDKQYFEGIEPEVWEYKIGGYQVCDKWLKDRTGRLTLSLGEIKHYCKIVTAIQKTIEIQKEIDGIYPEVEKDLINFNL
ncbi:MAG: type ISP restriction/modification enzyme [Candidatus Cloacimonadota bacterium]|nr:type ISP restriction/modification enzyme [Candidatus Cloacimonadota bacterium]